VRWLPPYEHLNGAERPQHFFKKNGAAEAAGAATAGASGGGVG